MIFKDSPYQLRLIRAICHLDWWYFFLKFTVLSISHVIQANNRVAELEMPAQFLRLNKGYRIIDKMTEYLTIEAIIRL